LSLRLAMPPCIRVASRRVSVRGTRILRTSVAVEPMIVTEGGWTSGSIPSERSEPVSSRASGASRGICTWQSAGRHRGAAVSRGARGGRGGTTRGARPRGRDRCTCAPRLSSHDFKIFNGPGQRSLPQAPRPPRAEAGRGLPGRTTPRPPREIPCAIEPESRTAPERRSVPRPFLIPSFPQITISRISLHRSSPSD
jgi:hypothetical protein